MARFLRGVNGVIKSFDESSTTPIYDQSIEIVASGQVPPDSLNGPINAGTAITLPASGSYTVTSSVPNINVYVNGQRLEYLYDWAVSGSGPSYTAIQLTFDLSISDRIDIRAERS